MVLKRAWLDPELIRSPSVVSRFMSKVDKVSSGCWIWARGFKNNDGYGVFAPHKTMRSAHRVSWVMHRGPIPDNLEVNHLCEVKACVNPDHLELTTHSKNMRYGNNHLARQARQTHCHRGHEFTPENTRLYRGSRFCRTCGNQFSREYTQRKKANRRVMIEMEEWL